MSSLPLLTSLLILAFVISFFDWAIRSANWFTIIKQPTSVLWCCLSSLYLSGAWLWLSCFRRF